MTNNPEDKIVKLHDYQEIAKNFIMTRPKCALLLDMGLGKTLTTLDAIYDINPPCHVLIIAPKMVAANTWGDEVKKWGYPLNTINLFANAKGKTLTKKKRYEQYELVKTSPASLCFISQDLVKDLVEYFKVNPCPGGHVWPFHMVVIDELQNFKSPISGRYKALRSVTPYIWRLVGLTGTPVTKDLSDLWAQAFLLDDGERLGRTIMSYHNTYFNEGYRVNNKVVSWRIKPHADKAIHDKVSDIMMSMRNKELNIPTTYNTIKIKLPDEARKQYDTLLQTFVLPMNDDEEIIAQSAATLSIKLRQLASGTLYHGDDLEYLVIHKEKLNMLSYIIESNTTPVLVAYNFKSDIKEIMNAIPSAELFNGESEQIARWNAGEIPVLLAHPASAGAGLNLQQGGHTLVWYTLPWSLEHYLQMNARLARQGQMNPVVIHHLVTEESIDEKVVKALESRELTSNALLEAVKVSIER